MPSYNSYMAMKVKDLRHELASRDLPTEGLKRDLAFRLASLDDPLDCRPSNRPHSTRASPSMTNDEEEMLAKLGMSNSPTTEAREKSHKPVSSSGIDTSFPSIYDRDHDQGNKDRRTSNLARRSIVFTFGFLVILLFCFLIAVLWRYVPTVHQEYFSRSMDNGLELVSLKINACQDLMMAQFLHGYNSMHSGLQFLGAFLKQVSMAVAFLVNMVITDVSLAS